MGTRLFRQVAITKRHFTLGLLALSGIVAWLAILSGLILASSEASADKDHAISHTSGIKVGSLKRAVGRNGFSSTNDVAVASPHVRGNRSCVVDCSGGIDKLDFDKLHYPGPRFFTLEGGDSSGGANRGFASPSEAMYAEIFDQARYLPFGTSIPSQPSFISSNGSSADADMPSGSGDAGWQGADSQNNADGPPPPSPDESPFVRHFDPAQLPGGITGPVDPDVNNPNNPQIVSQLPRTSQPVPEPTTIAIFILGLGIAATIRRRARSSP